MEVEEDENATTRSRSTTTPAQNEASEEHNGVQDAQELVGIKHNGSFSNKKLGFCYKLFLFRL